MIIFQMERSVTDSDGQYATSARMGFRNNDVVIAPKVCCSNFSSYISNQKFYGTQKIVKLISRGGGGG